MPLYPSKLLTINLQRESPQKVMLSKLSALFHTLLIFFLVILVSLFIPCSQNYSSLLLTFELFDYFFIFHSPIPLFSVPFFSLFSTLPSLISVSYLSVMLLKFVWIRFLSPTFRFTSQLSCTFHFFVPSSISFLFLSFT